MGHKIKGRRSFKIIASTNPNKLSGGRYMAENAYGAGRKAATKLFQGTNFTDVRFILKESTLRSDKHTYMYIAHRVKLERPRVVSKIDKETGKKIEYKVFYDIQLSELPQAQAGDLMVKAGLSAAPAPSPAPSPTPPPTPTPQAPSSFDVPPLASIPTAQTQTQTRSNVAKKTSPKGKGKGDGKGNSKGSGRGNATESGK